MLMMSRIPHYRPTPQYVTPKFATFHDVKNGTAMPDRNDIIVYTQSIQSQQPNMT